MHDPVLQHVTVCETLTHSMLCLTDWGSCRSPAQSTVKARELSWLQWISQWVTLTF